MRASLTHIWFSVNPKGLSMATVKVDNSNFKSDVLEAEGKTSARKIVRLAP